MKLSKKLILPFAAAAITIACGLDDDDGGGVLGVGEPIHRTDPAGDHMCDEAGAVPDPAVDLVAFDAEEVGGNLEVTCSFAGDAEAYEASGSGDNENFPFSLQFMTKDSEYIEVFFSGGKLKVADNKLDLVNYAFSTYKLGITLSGITLDGIDTVKASTFSSGYPDYSGFCTDEI